MITHEFHLFSRQLKVINFKRLKIESHLNRPKFIQAAKGRWNNSALSNSSDANVVLHSRNARIRHSSFSARRAAGKMLARTLEFVARLIRSLVNLYRLFPRARDALLCSRSRRSSRRKFWFGEDRSENRQIRWYLREPCDSGSSSARFREPAVCDRGAFSDQERLQPCTKEDWWEQGDSFFYILFPVWK